VPPYPTSSGGGSDAPTDCNNIQYEGTGVNCRALAALVLTMLTVPVAAHWLGRAAYLSKLP